MTTDHLLAVLEAIHRVQMETNRSQTAHAQAIGTLREDVARLEGKLDKHTSTRLGRFLDTLEQRPSTVWAALAILGLSLLVLSVLLIFVLDHIDVGQAIELKKALKGRE